MSSMFRIVGWVIAFLLAADFGVTIFMDRWEGMVPVWFARGFDVYGWDIQRGILISMLVFGTLAFVREGKHPHTSALWWLSPKWAAGPLVIVAGVIFLTGILMGYGPTPK